LYAYDLQPPLIAIPSPPNYYNAYILTAVYM